MKFIPATGGQLLHRLELTRRNLEVLLAKLDDDLSKKQLVDPDWNILVAAKEQEDAEHGAIIGGRLIAGAENGKQCVEIVPVENAEHYSDRAPGPMVMPSTGTVI